MTILILESRRLQVQVHITTVLLHFFAKFPRQCGLYSLIFIKHLALINCICGIITLELRSIFIVEDIVHRYALLTYHMLADRVSNLLVKFCAFRIRYKVSLDLIDDRLIAEFVKVVVADFL